MTLNGRYPVIVPKYGATRISVRKLELRHEHMVVGGGRRLYRVAHRPQVPAVENMVEYVGVPAPSGLLRLHRPITERSKLPHQRVVAADVEITPDQRRAVRRAQLRHHELELAGVDALVAASARYAAERNDRPWPGRCPPILPARGFAAKLTI